MDTDLDTLATALYVFTDDALKDHPERVPARPRVGIAPKITDPGELAADLAPVPLAGRPFRAENGCVAVRVTSLFLWSVEAVN